MSGTKAGGRKAAAKNLAKDPNFYSKIGAKGGRNGRTGGFAAYTVCHCNVIKGEHHLAQCSGYKGGVISRRSKMEEVDNEQGTSGLPTTHSEGTA